MDAGVADAARPRDRVPRLRGRPRAGVPAAGRPAAALPRAARARGARRQRRRRGRRGLGALRSDARQGDRAGRDARRRRSPARSRRSVTSRSSASGPTCRSCSPCSRIRAFVAGEIDTRFLDRETPALVAARRDAPVPEGAFAAAARGVPRGSVQAPTVGPAADGRRGRIRGTSPGRGSGVVSTFSPAGGRRQHRARADGLVGRHASRSTGEAYQVHAISGR